MNPSSNETPGIQLPAPVEQMPQPSVPEATPAQPEQAARPERASGPAQVAPPAAPPATPLPQVMMPTLPQQGVQASTATASLVASDDTDLIEKEWVLKAKAIVERTRNDPQKQSEELTMVKADYMKKRYNKTIKLNS